MLLLLDLQLPPHLLGVFVALAQHLFHRLIVHDILFDVASTNRMHVALYMKKPLDELELTIRMSKVGGLCGDTHWIQGSI